MTRLIPDLTNLGPDEAFSTVPYMKGSIFLRYIEDLVGGPSVFEPFLKFYLNKFKFQSIVTDDFKKTLYDFFKDTHMNALEQIDWTLWLTQEGMPPIIPKLDTTLSDESKKHADLWADNTVATIKVSPLINEALSSEQVIEFLTQLLAKDVKELTQEKADLLASVYKIEKTQNAEIRMRYLRLIIRGQFESKLDEIITFANSNYRMKFVRPIYRDLGGWPMAKPIAIANFQKIRKEMMKQCEDSVARDLGIE